MWIRLRIWAVVCGIALLAPGGTVALPADTLKSVVSVIPEWPGQLKGGTGARPGMAPEGSGIVLAPGIVATAWHVVQPAKGIEVRLFDGRIVAAELLAADASTDIALLTIEADLPAVTLAPEYDLAQRVCAAGNAYGLGLSVVCGVISAVGVSNAGFNPVEDFVQTDAAINPGMSGGGLFDENGELVGMVSAIFASEADGNIGVNFAVSSVLLDRVAGALQREGEVRFPEPGWSLGIPDRRTLARIAAPEIVDVLAGGAAGISGFRTGDLVLAVSGRRVQSPRDVVAALAVLPQDVREVSVQIERGGNVQELRLDLGQATRPEHENSNSSLGDCPHPPNVCRVRQAVFPVSSFDPIGSATRIGSALLVTNRHVVGDRTDAVVQTPDGPRGARVVPSSYDGDLVLLDAPGLPESGYIPELQLSDTFADRFYAIGADITRQEVRVFDPGELILPPAESAPLARLHVRARMQPGVSGGALVGETGELMGIAVGGGDGRFEAIPASDVLRLLALREDRNAAEVTTRLGNAFALCASGLDSARDGRADAQTLRGIVGDCGAAANQGQLLEAGRVLAGAGDFDEAAALHGSAVDQVPNSINARMSLLVSLQLGARFEEMTPHARRLMEMAPEDPQALRFAIQSGVWGDDPQLAEAGYTALLAADPIQAQAARRFIDSAPPAPPRR